MELLISEYRDQKMQIDFKIPTYNVRIINFDVILRDTLKIFKSDCFKYSLPTEPFYNTDCKKLFIHALIVSICDRIKSIHTIEKKLLYVNQNTSYISLEMKDSVLKLINKVLSNLSLVSILGDSCFNKYTNELLHRNVDSMYLFNIAYNKINKNSNINLNKLLAFLKVNGLIFLFNTYFKDTSNKMAVF